MADWIMRSAQAWFDKDEQATFYERFQYLQEAERLFESLAPAVRYGRTLSYILQRVSLPIRPRREAARRGGGAHPHGGTARGRGGGESSRWWDLAPGNRSRSRSCGTTPMAGSAGRPPWFFALGHLGLDWEALVRDGIPGFEARARHAALQPGVGRSAQGEPSWKGPCFATRPSPITSAATLPRPGAAAQARGETSPRNAKQSCSKWPRTWMATSASGAPRCFREACSSSGWSFCRS